MKTVPVIAAVALLGLTGGSAPSRANLSAVEVRILSAVGMRQVMLVLGPGYEQVSGNRLSIVYDSGAIIARRVLDGETADLVLLPQAGIDQLAQAGRIVPDPIPLASSYIGVAVRAGAQKPDISSPTALKRALLDAKVITVPDPALGGSSGVHLARMFEKLGIAEALKGKLLLSSTPQDESTLPGALVAAGKADIALHQMQELRAVAGLQVVGSLPKELDETFVFSAAVLKGSAQPAASQALIQFLRTSAAAGVIRLIGMNPMRRYRDD